MKVIYRANDGKEFTDVNKCVAYEAKKTPILPSVYSHKVGEKDIRLFDEEYDEIDFNANPESICEVDPPEMGEVYTIFVSDENARNKLVELYELIGDLDSAESVPDFDEFHANTYQTLTFDTERDEWIPLDEKLRGVMEEADKRYQSYQDCKELSETIRSVLVDVWDR